MPPPQYRYPETAVLYRRLKRTFPKIVRGEGCWLFDDEGRKYLDACGGAYVSNIGHGVAEIGAAMAEQARRVAYVNGTAFTCQPVEELAELLAQHSAPGLDKVFFLNSGSDATEAAIKVARQHWFEAGRPSKSRIIGLTPSYHGSGLLAMAVSARNEYKKALDGWIMDFPKIPAPYPYRQAANDPALTGEALEAEILRQGADTVAAFIAEPVGGSSTGCSVPAPAYWKRIREICDKHEVLFIADEVLCGAGRTGTWSALEPYGVSPDIQIFAKGLTGGYGALSALVTSRKVLDPIAAGSGSILHAQTFSQHPVMCAAGLAAMRYIAEHRLVERAAAMGKVLHEKLEDLRSHACVGDVRGRGLLAGVEFVADKASKRPFPRAAKFSETFAETAQAMGLVVWESHAQADGTNGDLAMLAPPFVISESEIDQLVALFKQALDATVRKVSAKA